MACAMPPSGGGDAGAHRPGQEGQGHQVVSLPLLTPLNLPLRRDSLWSRSETGVTGARFRRRFAYRTLLCPEFTLRDLPRITVRGQTVQGGGVPLRKSSASIKNMPLEHQTSLWTPRFLDARPQESRPKEDEGELRGIRNHSVSYPPFAPAAGRRQCTRHVMANIPPSRGGRFRLQRRTAVPAEGIPSANGQKGTAKTPN